MELPRSPEGSIDRETHEELRKFITKALLFSLPFVLLYIVVEISYSKTGGDLNRLGKIAIRDDYRDIFESREDVPRNYSNLDEISSVMDGEFDILTIGDSFSKQKELGYQNYVANMSELKVLNFSDTISGTNPLQVLYQILNGGILDHISVKWIVLQSAGRVIVERGQNLNHDSSIAIEDLANSTSEHSSQSKGPRFVDAIKFPVYNMLY
ncbi:MAG: hypothetical protein KC964_07375, partial [Candidatus Omnitrophica bacterium]|nr:hypothetical protein [Candidatus Omnitrophota bacterium]